MKRDLADKMYDPADYHSSNETDQGMAVTHEQVSDAYVEGTVEVMTEHRQGTATDEKIPRVGDAGE